MGATLYIKNTIEAVAFYTEAFGLTLGYNEKFRMAHLCMRHYLETDKKYSLSVNHVMTPLLILCSHHH